MNHVKKVINRPSGHRHATGFQPQRPGHPLRHADSGVLDASPPQKRGSRRETRSPKKASQITAFFKWLGGLVSNPATGKISHTKLWANVAAAAMTYKFSLAPDAPEWLWWAYGAMVGGYALIKRGIAAIPQVAEIHKGKDDVENA